MDLWFDATALATGVSMEKNGEFIEDASLLRPDNGSEHINPADVDEVIKASICLFNGK